MKLKNENNKLRTVTSTLYILIAAAVFAEQVKLPGIESI